VGLLLELREHGLAEQRRAEAFEVLVEDVSPQPCVFDGVEQVVREQGLVHRRGNFRDEDLVVCVDVRLSVAGVLAV